MTQTHTNFSYPTTLKLLAIGQTWEIHYEKTDYKGCKLIHAPDNKLTVLGDITNPSLVHKGLSTWLKELGKRHLVPWLQTLSDFSTLEFVSASIRGQKTRWGSCSSEKRINLNYFLLFLPCPLARHVLLHELCHIKHLNHSKRFWDLLQKLDENCQHHRRELREADRYLPAFLLPQRVF